ncbi:flagellar biosynthetic protein FliR [Paenibacillus lutrae]|uniref:Flagellar biosynthetic protein FliR n=1 Tax=Paenibacillus lutrae TaxID=2078573 RepID=A0A7X3FGC6_9BACL|nr:flagellar biosynthetic protein FliR [Paenibacillus lutrae]MVO99144.1 flagellar type III secretion system protein FliR [Paenibacillus lutrae]
MELFVQLLPNAMLIFCRMTSFFVVVPLFSSKNVPNVFKIGLALFLTLIVTATQGTTQLVVMDAQFVLLILREILVGITLGFIAYMFFTAVQIAGSFIDVQIGLGIANVLDPMTGTSVPILGNLKYMVAILLLLSFNGHHFLIQGIMNSYEWIPLSNEMFAQVYKGQISEFMIRTFSTMFALSMQLAAPIVAAMFLTDLGLGLLTRVAPQFNIFVIGVPLKLMVGFLLIALLMPELLGLFHGLFDRIFAAMQKFLNIVAGGPVEGS